MRAIPIEQVAPDPTRARRTRADIEELANSIRASGVREPLVVRPLGPDLTLDPGLDPGLGGEADGREPKAGAVKQRWMVVMGERRLAAALIAGLSVVPCLVRDIDEGQAVLDALLAGLHQQSLSPLEEAEQLQRLMSLRAVRVSALAALVGRSASFVSGRLAFLALPGPALEVLHAGLISVSEAGALAEIADYPDLITDLVEDVPDAGGGLDPYALKEAQRRAGLDRESQRLRAEAQAKGLRLIDTHPPHAGSAWVSTLDLSTHQAAAHARQSCHAVYLTTTMNSPRLVAVCTDPDRHKPKTPPPGQVSAPAPGGASGGPSGTGTREDHHRDDEQADEQGGERGDERGEGDDARAARQAGEERDAAWAAQRAYRAEQERLAQEAARNRKRVTSARRDFLAALTQKRTPKRSEALVFVFGSMIEHANQTTMTWVAGLLDLAPATGPYGEPDWRTPVASYAASSAENLLRVALLISSRWAEERIDAYPHGYHAYAARYIELLTTLGYTPDPFEMEQIHQGEPDPDEDTDEDTDEDSDEDSDMDDGTGSGDVAGRNQDSDLNTHGEVTRELTADAGEAARQIAAEDSTDDDGDGSDAADPVT